MDNLISVPISAFRDIFKRIPVHVYYWISNEQYEKVVNKDEEISYQQLAHYISSGMKQFYIDPKDKQDFDNFLANSPSKVFGKTDSPIEKKQIAFQSILEQSYFYAKEVKVIDQIESAKLSTAFKLAVSNNGRDDFIPLLIYLLQNSVGMERMFRHAINTCAYSYLLVKEVEKDSLNNMRILLLASFVHDFGKSLLPEDQQYRFQIQDESQLKDFENHPVLTTEMIDHMLSFSSVEITKCVKQHKERNNGSGYPYKLKENLIYELTKILSIADYFSELTLGMTDGIFHPQYEALKILHKNSGSFEKQFVDKFIPMLSGFTVRTQMEKVA